jgi:hypothetical protein
MTVSRGLKILSVTCFILAVFSVPLSALAMIAIGLGIKTLSEVT